MPYNPGIQYRGDIHLAQGIGDFGRSLGQFLSRRGEERKKLNKNAKIADAMVRANPEALDALGMDAEEFAGLSAEDKVASTQGLLQANAMQSASAQLATELSRGDLARENIKSMRLGREREVEQARQTAGLLESWGSAQNGDLGQAVENFPGADPGMVARLAAIDASKEGRNSPLAQARLEVDQMNAETNRKIAEARLREFELRAKAGESQNFQMIPMSQLPNAQDFAQEGVDMSNWAFLRDENKTQLVDLSTGHKYEQMALLMSVLTGRPLPSGLAGAKAPKAVGPGRQSGNPTFNPKTGQLEPAQ